MPQPPTLFFEHERRPYPWTDPDLRALERLTRSLGSEPLRPTITPTGQHALQSFQHVGLLHLPSGPIQILPKTHRTPITDAPSLAALRAIATPTPTRAPTPSES